MTLMVDWVVKPLLKQMDLFKPPGKYATYLSESYSEYAMFQSQLQQTSFLNSLFIIFSPSRKHLYNFDHLKPHVYIVKRVYRV